MSVHWAERHYSRSAARFTETLGAACACNFAPVCRSALAKAKKALDFVIPSVLQPLAAVCGRLRTPAITHTHKHG